MSNRRPLLPGTLNLLILKSVTALPDWGWAWGVTLVTTLFGVIGFARAGSAVFWKSGADEGGAAPTPASRADLIAPAIALALLAALSAGAGWASAYSDAAAAQVLDRETTARAVLGEGQP